MTERLVHSHALVESSDVGNDTRVWAFAHVMKGAVIGERCNIGEGVFVEAGVIIGNDVTVKNGVALYDGLHVSDDVFLGPNCVFTNDRRPRSGRYKRSPDKFEKTYIERGASIGANATIVCGVRIGVYAMVGAGAVVTHDVPAFTLVLGVPARGVAAVCACGDKLAQPQLICGCGLSYVRDADGIHPLESL